MRESVTELLRELERRDLKLIVCESMTGGMLSSAITDVPGASKTFLGGFVTYSYELKERIGVQRDTLLTYGAVSERTAEEMAITSLRILTSFGYKGMAISVTGNAGPSSQEGKPVGTFFVGVALSLADGFKVTVFREEGRRRGGDPSTLRDYNRRYATKFAVRKALELLKESDSGELS